MYTFGTDKLKQHIDKPEFVNNAATFLNQIIKKIDSHGERPLVTFCIGTDRSTGDALGPLVGYLLQKKQPFNNLIYGTIDNPVHAVNIEETLAAIYKNHKNPLIIAVDACLGKLENIGCVNIFQGSLKPGLAVNKNLPAVGDISISGIVNVGGFMEYLVLQNTRLSFVMQMAEKVSDCLAKVYCTRSLENSQIKVNI